MLEVKLTRRHRGKKSRWRTKFPRNRVFHRGDEKLVDYYSGNWDDDNWGVINYNALERWLKSNVGRLVDMVFSDFCKRCDASARKKNLTELFYGFIEKKESIGIYGGFYVTNGILNYKKRAGKIRKLWYQK